MDLLKKYIDEKEFYTSFLISKIYENEFKNNDEFKKLFSEIICNIEDKKIVEKKIKIYLMCNWCNSYDLCKLWNKMSQDNNYSWNNIEIVWNEPCDYYCIINKPPDNIKFDSKKTIVFRMEPYMNKDKRLWGDYWSNPPKEDFLFIGFHSNFLNNLEWHISKNYKQLMNEEIVKDNEISNVLSTVLSNKYQDPGHIKRIDFIKYLEKKINVHVFGGNRFLWKNFKGSLPYHEKNNSLLSYKYTFNVENHSIANYCTEKLVDGILSECLTFYSGCPNIKDIINEKAYVYLELSNFEKDYQIIKKAIEEDLWSKRLPFIKAEKKRILNDLQFFPRLEKIINKN